MLFKLDTIKITPYKAGLKQFCSVFKTFLCIFSLSVLIVAFKFLYSIPLMEYSIDWPLIKLVIFDVSFLEFSDSVPAFSWNSEIPSPPNLVQSESRTRSSFEQICPPVIDGMNLKRIISSSGIK